MLPISRQKRNDTDHEIRTFTLQEMAPIEEQVGAFTVFLNESVILSGGTTRNVMSSLIADLSRAAGSRCGHHYEQQIGGLLSTSAASFLFLCPCCIKIIVELRRNLLLFCKFTVLHTN